MSSTSDEISKIVHALGNRSIVFVGMMGAGKSAVGRRIASRLGLPFVDADVEIEAAAGMTIPEIFEKLGEPAFRTGEAKVIARLLAGGPQVLATGGGALMNPATQERIRDRGVSIWLKADIATILRRIEKKSDRPLARRIVELMPLREPIYALSDITVLSRDEPHEMVVEEIVAALPAKLGMTAVGNIS